MKLRSPNKDNKIMTQNLVPTNLSLMEKLQWLKTNAENNEEYTIELTNNENISSQTLSFSNRSNIALRLISSDGEKIISLLDVGSLFTVESGVTLILDNNITLNGHDKNNSALVDVCSGGTLIMKTGSKIRGNTNDGGRGGGVDIKDGGRFIMEDGEIFYNNTICTEDDGSCDMMEAFASMVSIGAGVSCIGNFTMKGGKIYKNTTKYFGGGVFVWLDGSFTMEGGEIFNNEARHGGGVVVSSGGKFNMEDGKISNNKAKNSGGGVYVSNANKSIRRGLFTQSGSNVYDNKPDNIVGKTENPAAGCYIATAVYNSYNAPEVLCLRRFRDEILSTSTIGRLFIRAYYFFSPPIAEKLKKTRVINMLVRKILDKIVVRLNNKFNN